MGNDSGVCNTPTPKTRVVGEGPKKGNGPMSQTCMLEECLEAVMH